MENNCDISVVQVANGFIITPRFSIENSSMSVGNNDTFVAQSFSELTLFLNKHFSHRNYEETFKDQK